MKTYDLNSESSFDTRNGNVEDVAAFDNGPFVGVDGGNLYAWDENLNQLASTDIGGSGNTPPIPFEEDDGTKMIYTTENVSNGTISAYEFDGSSLTKEWEETMGERGGIGIMYGDSILISGVGGPKVLNRIRSSRYIVT